MARTALARGRSPRPRAPPWTAATARGLALWPVAPRRSLRRARRVTDEAIADTIAAFAKAAGAAERLGFDTVELHGRATGYLIDQFFWEGRRCAHRRIRWRLGGPWPLCRRNLEGRARRGGAGSTRSSSASRSGSSRTTTAPSSRRRPTRWPPGCSLWLTQAQEHLPLLRSAVSGDRSLEGSDLSLPAGPRSCQPGAPPSPWARWA